MVFDMETQVRDGRAQNAARDRLDYWSLRW